MSEQIKDFTRPEYKNPVMDMWEFYNDNPHFSMIRYEFVKGGIRTFYVVVN